jgi:hypothetical protein
MADNEFTQLQRAVSEEESAIKVLKGEIVEAGFKTVARAKARLLSYERVAANYSSYIETQARKLADGAFEGSPFREIGVARLIAGFLAESELFFKEVEPLLGNSESAVRQGFFEQSFEGLSKEVQEQLLNELDVKKQELLVWFVSRVQEVLAERKA